MSKRLFCTNEQKSPDSSSPSSKEFMRQSSTASGFLHVGRHAVPSPTSPDGQLSKAPEIWSPQQSIPKPQEH
eukprot:2681784-Rhodomonas_salina.3